MQIPFFSQLTRRIGIDLGSSRTRIWTDREGVVLDEPSYVAIDPRTQKVIAVGKEAAAMVGRVGPDITILNPIKQGHLYDSQVARAMLKVFLQTVLKTPYFLRPVVMVSVPSDTTESIRQLTTELMYSVGAREVYTISQPLAAAIGAGVPIADASGTFVVQIGEGVMEAAIISLGSLVASQTSVYAGAYVDNRLTQTLKAQRQLLISLEEAEKLKREVGSLLSDSGRSRLVSGQDLVASSPKEVEVSAELIQKPLVEVVKRWVGVVKKLLSDLAPELTVDVIDKGILLSGGGSQLHGLEPYLMNELGVAVTMVENPDRRVIEGVGIALENIDLFKESLAYVHN